MQDKQKTGDRKKWQVKMNKFAKKIKTFFDFYLKICSICCKI